MVRRRLPYTVFVGSTSTWKIRTDQGKPWSSNTLHHPEISFHLPDKILDGLVTFLASVVLWWRDWEGDLLLMLAAAILTARQVKEAVDFGLQVARMLFSVARFVYNLRI